MVILDRRLDERARAGEPVNVALVGSGFMGRAVARRLVATTGLRLVAVANRTLAAAEAALADAGADASRTAVTTDAKAVCREASVDVVIEATGAIDHGAQVALEATASTSC